MKTLTPFAPLIILLAVAPVRSDAQKNSLDKQGIYAPTGLKIDGKITEWGNEPSAYNKSTQVFYAIANDAENLYLVLKIEDARVIEKVLDAGITFTLNTTGKKDFKNSGNVVITFPDLNTNYVFDILRKAGDKSHWGGVPAAMGGMLISRDVLTRTDSTVMLANKLLTEQAKTITIHGVSSIADTSISVYNENSIKAASAFNNKGNYIYELAFPLKYLNSAGSLTKFFYNIKLNGFDTGGMYMLRETKVNMPTDPDVATTTNFWGEYTLVKK